LSNNVVASNPNFGAVSTRFAAQSNENDLSAGVQVGFGIIGYKGKVWSTRFRGTNTDLMRHDGDGPMNSVEIVILKASAHVSKIWYENGWVEGSNAAPDCFSTNGITPDIGAKKRQHTSCALCPKNQWGSRITPQGKQGKACGDSKRLAIVPLPDIANEGLGGPMLLRVPAASLGDLATFGDKYKAMGYPYFSIGVRIAFDPKESYPKFTFSAIRPLTDAEADLVLQMRDSAQVNRILAEGSEHAAPASGPEQFPAGAFEQPPQNSGVDFAALAAKKAAEQAAAEQAAAEAAKVQQPTQNPAPQPTQNPAPATTGGFGGKAVPSQPVGNGAATTATTQSQATTQATSASSATTVAPISVQSEADASDFEKALDAQLNDLLPA
jgi:hypothetical protein